ncbi:MAG: hypothetical protein PUF66_05995 [Clostridium sp.]|nr:hypothetical protein [Clostridium sp.]
MVNFIYLVVLCLLVAIVCVSCYKFFRAKRWKEAISSLIYILLVVITSIIFFSGRLTVLEFDYLINSLKTGNIFGIIVLILQILLVVSAIFNYYQIIKISKNRR